MHKTIPSTLLFNKVSSNLSNIGIFLLAASFTASESGFGSIKKTIFIFLEVDNLFMIIVSKTDVKVFISCFISKELVEQRELNASNIVKELSSLIDGNGGGQKFFATAGGKNIDGIESVLSQSEKIISQI